ncbi:MFS transporter [Streptomyces sp. cg36]|uniref:MFS transporter n=1 Tax=Streptomyces sp. cg36 TaxID=3238798 RepID=UPI0034E1BC3D
MHQRQLSLVHCYFWSRGVRCAVQWATRTHRSDRALITLEGFLSGHDTGVVSGALLFIRDTYGLSPFQQGCLVSVLLIGAMIGALAAGRTPDRLGRRETLALEGAVFVVGALIVSLARPAVPRSLTSKSAGNAGRCTCPDAHCIDRTRLPAGARRRIRAQERVS